MRRILFALLSGLALVAAWPPSEFNFLILVAWMPLLHALFEKDNRKSRAYFLSYLACAGFSFGTMWWLFTVQGDGLTTILITLAMLAIPAVMAIPFWLSFLVFRKRGMSWALIVLPFFVAGLEILVQYWDLGFTWLHQGLAMANTPSLMKAYPLLGQQVGTLQILAVNGSMLILLKRWHIRKARPMAIALPVLLVLTMLIPITGSKKGNVQKLKVAVLQPNLDTYSEMSNDETLVRYDSLMAGLDMINTDSLDLIVCPEGYFRDMRDNPIIVNDFHRHKSIGMLKELSQKMDAPILTGSLVIRLYFEEQKNNPTARQKREGLYWDQYNAALFITPDGRVEWRTKNHLVPFMERVPFIDKFSALESLHLTLNQAKGSYARIENSKPFVWKSMRIVPILCQESLFPNRISSYVQRRANLIVEMSNETWSTSVLPRRQHAGYALVNVAQFRLPYLRSSFASTSQVTDIQFVTQRLPANRSMGVFSVEISGSGVKKSVHRNYVNVVLLVAFLIGLLSIFGRSVKPS